MVVFQISHREGSSINHLSSFYNVISFLGTSIWLNWRLDDGPFSTVQLWKHVTCENGSYVYLINMAAFMVVEVTLQIELTHSF